MGTMITGLDRHVSFCSLWTVVVRSVQFSLFEEENAIVGEGFLFAHLPL